MENEEKLKDLRTLTLVVYVLQALGFFVLAADTVWIIYRIVKGALDLNDGKPLYRPSVPSASA